MTANYPPDGEAPQGRYLVKTLQRIRLAKNLDELVEICKTTDRRKIPTRGRGKNFQAVQLALIWRTRTLFPPTSRRTRTAFERFGLLLDPKFDVHTIG